MGYISALTYYLLLLLITTMSGDAEAPQDLKSIRRRCICYLHPIIQKFKLTCFGSGRQHSSLGIEINVTGHEIGLRLARIVTRSF